MFTCSCVFQHCACYWSGEGWRELVDPSDYDVDGYSGGESRGCSTILCFDCDCTQRSRFIIEGGSSRNHTGSRIYS